MYDDNDHARLRRSPTPIVRRRQVETGLADARPRYIGHVPAIDYRSHQCTFIADMDGRLAK